MATIGLLDLVMRANTADFRRGLKGARSSIKKFVRSALSITSAVGGVSAALSAGAIIAWTRKTAESIDTQAKFARRIGESTQELGGLEHAAGLTGNKINVLRMGLQRMTRRVAEAAQGTGEAQGAIRELGLDAKRLEELTPVQQFGVFADAMGRVRGEANKVRLSFKLFDSEGVALKNTLALGSEGLREMRDEAIELGIAVDQVGAEKVQRANDAMTRVKGAIQGVVNSVTIELAPVLEQAAKQLLSTGRTGEKMGDRVARGMKEIVSWVAEVVEKLRFMAAGFKIVLGFFQLGIAGIVKALSWLVKKIVSVLDWLGVAPRGLIDFADSFDKAADSIIKTYKAKVDEGLADWTAAGGTADRIKKKFEEIKAAADAVPWGTNEGNLKGLLARSAPLGITDPGSTKILEEFNAAMAGMAPEAQKLKKELGQFAAIHKRLLDKGYVKEASALREMVGLVRSRLSLEKKQAEFLKMRVRAQEVMRQQREDIVAEFAERRLAQGEFTTSLQRDLHLRRSATDEARALLSVQFRIADLMKQGLSLGLPAEDLRKELADLAGLMTAEVREQFAKDGAKNAKSVTDSMSSTLKDGLGNIIKDGMRTGFQNGADIARRIMDRLLGQIIDDIASSGIGSLFGGGSKGGSGIFGDILGGITSLFGGGGGLGGGGGIGAVLAPAGGGGGIDLGCGPGG